VPIVGDDALRSRIAQALKGYSHRDLPAAAATAGITVDPADDGVTKMQRAVKGLAGLDRKTLAAIAQRLGALSKYFELEEMGSIILEEGQPAITEITRREVAGCFGYEFAGDRSHAKLLQDLRDLFPIDAISSDSSFFPYRSLADDIAEHMLRNKGENDFDTEKLFDRMGALTCSCYRFAKLVVGALDPNYRRDANREQLAGEISAVLRRAGYRLEVTSEDGGHPIYGVTAIHRGVDASPKNLIFASNGVKPELGFIDAVSNDVIILSGGDHCLIYGRPIPRKTGLPWSDLVDWWKESRGSEGDAAKALGHRLFESLASDAERNLFKSYFTHAKPKVQALPALIPQVYLHYDPGYVREVRHRKTFFRQRMDFLLLLPDGIRVVIEVDGERHFCQNKQPSLEKYSKMVAADRDLKLYGYEVYRFGANELVGPRASALVEHFFERLFAVHRVI
jgi:hypothetical protein